MEQATLSKGFLERRAIVEIGGVEVLWGHVGALRWDDIPKDCLPVVLYETTNPKAVVCANRMQLDTIRKMDNEFVRKCFIVEISRILKHSNLTYCEDTIEKDRKFPHKKRKLLSNTKKLIMKEIVQSLNRSRTAEEIAATYGTSKVSINLMADKLRKPPYNFNIPGARGFDEFATFAKEIAAENPELVRRAPAPLAKNINHFQNTRLLLGTGDIKHG